MDLDRQFDDDVAQVTLGLQTHGSILIELDCIGYAEAVADTVAANLGTAKGQWVDCPHYLIINKKKVPSMSSYDKGIYRKDWLPGNVRPAIAVVPIEFDPEMFIITMLEEDDNAHDAV